MITFQKLKIRNFKSIAEAELAYSSGVWEVIGTNNDSAFSSNGSGKALANSEPVLTDDGFKPIGELTLSDTVIGSDGKAKKIKGIYPQGVRDIYKVTFRDNTYSMCDAEHIWTLQKGWGKKSHVEDYKVQELIDDGLYTEFYDKRYNKKYKTYKYSLGLGEPCEYGHSELPLDPYLLGLLLGDGSITTSTIKFTNASRNIIDDLISKLPIDDAIGVDVFREGAYSISIINKSGKGRYKERRSMTAKVLSNLGLLGKNSKEKFIPDIYLRASLKDRRALLQGLIDTDGYVTDGILREYSTSSNLLADGFLELGRSCGMYLTKASRKSGYKKDGVYHECVTSYRIIENVKDLKALVSIEYSHKEEATCISVDSEDQLFVTRDFNLTHNTTILEGIQQCLFNKTTASPPIEDATRKSVGAKVHKRIGYRLEVTFTKDNDQYRVVNDREAMRIQIFKNEEDMLIKSIPNALKEIVSIIGMDFNTFVTLTFINHDTIVGLLDNFSSSSLMKVILNFSQISDFEKSAKQEKKILTNSILSIASQVHTTKEALELVSQFKEVDMEPLHIKKANIIKSLHDIKTSLLPEVEKKESLVEEAKGTLKAAINKYEDAKHKFSESKCKCCGQFVDMTEEGREKLYVQIIGLEDEISKLELAVQELEITASRHRETYQTTLNEVEIERDSINDTITVAQTKNQLYNDNKAHTEDLRKKLADLTIKQENLEFRSTVIQTALLVLKSGDIQKDLLTTFVAVLNVHLAHFINFVSLDYITIKAEASKANVAFKIDDTRFSHAISIHTLSGGEKTRLRLVVLLSMLQTIKEISDTSTNILVFDESLDTLDESAAGDLANLFDYLVAHDNKFIALVSHGEQLKDISFSGKILAEKTNGVTKVNKDTYV